MKGQTTDCRLWRQKIGGEINRNEQCPHEGDLRRLRLRIVATFETAERHRPGGVRGKAPPFPLF